jgi:hypothetical protein
LDGIAKDLKNVSKNDAGLVSPMCLRENRPAEASDRSNNTPADTEIRGLGKKQINFSDFQKVMF